MARLIWSPQAASDLANICEFIAQDSPEYAHLTAQRIIEVVESIPALPRGGRIVPELGSPVIRERIVGDYRVIYRMRQQAVEIVTIIHGARRLRFKNTS